jgi:hypothetical protein
MRSVAPGESARSGIAFLHALRNTVNVWYRIDSEGTFQVEYPLANSRLRQVKHDAKARLTIASTGAGGGEGARTFVQVLANSLAASILILAHLWLDRQYRERRNVASATKCFAPGSSPADLLVVGIIAYVESYTTMQSC